MTTEVCKEQPRGIKLEIRDEGVVSGEKLS